MQHHSGHDDYPHRGDSDLLKHLDEAADALTVQKLQVEATVRLASALESIAEAVGQLSHYDYGLRGQLDVSLKNDFSDRSLSVVVSRADAEPAK